MIVFHKRLFQLREARGLTQAELGGLLGVSQQCVWKWESGRSEPDIEKINRLATIFRVTCDYLMGRSESSDYFVYDIPVEGMTGVRLLTPDPEPPSPEEMKRLQDIALGKISTDGSYTIQANQLEERTRFVLNALLS